MSAPGRRDSNLALGSPPGGGLGGRQASTMALARKPSQGASLGQLLSTSGKWQLDQVRRVQCRGLTLAFFVDGRDGQEEADALEASFRLSNAKRYRPVLTNLSLLALIGNLLFIGYDYLLFYEDDKDAFMSSMYLRLGVMTPTCAALWAFTRSNLYYSEQSTALLAVMSTLVGVMILGYTIATEDTGFATLLMFVVFMHNITPMPFYVVTSLSVLMLVGYLASLLLVDSDNRLADDVIINNVGMVVLFVLMVSFPNWAGERHLRLIHKNEKMQTLYRVLLEEKQEHSQALLRSMLPDVILRRLKERHQRPRRGQPDGSPNVIADKYGEVTVLFCQICDFPKLSATLSPGEVVTVLNVVYSAFDRLTDEHNVHKVETVSEVYMVVAGCPHRCTNHAQLAANCALAMQAEMDKVRDELRDQLDDVERLQIRIGINTGAIVAGVVGIKNPRFKLFGDTVNTSSRMESTAEFGYIQCSPSTHAKLGDDYLFSPRGDIKVKGKGMMATYYLVGRKPGVPPRGVPAYLDGEAPATENSPLAGSRLSRASAGDAAAAAAAAGSAEDAPPAPLVQVVPTADEAAVVDGGAASSMSSLHLSDAVPAGGDKSPRVSEREREREGGAGGNIARVTPVNSSPRGHVRASRVLMEPNNDVGMLLDHSDHNNYADEWYQQLPPELKTPKFLWNVHGPRRAGPMEREFMRKHYMRNLKFLRNTLVIGFCMAPLFVFSDNLRVDSGAIDDEIRATIQLIRYGLVMPFLAISWLLTHSKYFTRTSFHTTAFILFVLGHGLLTISIVGKDPGYTVIGCYMVFIMNISLTPWVLRVAVNLSFICVYAVANRLHNSDEQPLSAWVRHVMYLFIFLLGQALPVAVSEYWLRLHHHRQHIVEQQHAKMLEEEKRNTDLLHQLLPSTVAQQMLNGRTLIADGFESTTVLFTDMVGFTNYSSKITPEQLVVFLNDMYSHFDRITIEHEIYKVEIIGDAYYVVGGCPVQNDKHAAQVVRAAIRMLDSMDAIRRAAGQAEIDIRVGVHTGPVIAGVVGYKDPRYHLFGDTVSVAEKMESSGRPGRIHITQATHDMLMRVAPEEFEFELADPVPFANHKNPITTYFVSSRPSG